MHCLWLVVVLTFVLCPEMGKELGRGLEPESEQWLRELGKVQPGEKEDQEDLLTLCSSLRGGGRGSHLSPRKQWTEEEETISSFAKAGSH